MKRLVLWLFVVLVIGFLPSTVFAQAQSSATPTKPVTATHHATGVGTRTDPGLLHPATLTAKAPEQYEVTFKTTAGDFVVQVTREWAPLGADRFYNLVKHGFFTDAAFFRVVPGFVIQFGLSANGAVNKVWDKATIKDDAVTQSNKEGYLTFATAGPNTRTTQLFINLADNARLDTMGFSAFGKVTSGMDAVQKIYSGYGEQPDQVQITSDGKAYLDKNFPKLDHIISAKITSPAPAAAAPAHKTAPKPANPQ